ncbi:MAG: hypothetical protein ACI4L9_06545, partial [Candidatus Coproplasma sp.]
RKAKYEVLLDEKIFHDPYISETNQAKDKIDRISDMLRNVTMFLATPLMEAVAKTPMLKPPITETNVLKMNKNFNGALKLYYFVAAYDKVGYSIETVSTVISPFNDELADRFAETAELCSFLTYECGTGIESVLKRRYLEEEKRRREQEEEKLRKQLQKLRKNIKEAGVTPEEYMLMLEKRNLRLENDSLQLKTAKAEIERQTAEIGRLNSEKDELILSVEEGKRELAEQSERHAEEINAINEQNQRMLDDVKRTHSEETARIMQNCEADKQKLRKEFAEQRGAYEQKIAEISEASRKQEQEISAFSGRIEKLNDEYTLLSARYNAVRREHGLFTEKDDFTSRESFDEIERQYEMFTKFFKEEWRKTKKRIRKEVFKAAAEDQGKKDDKD